MDRVILSLWHFFETYPAYRLMAFLLGISGLVCFFFGRRFGRKIDARQWAILGWAMLGLVFPYLTGIETWVTLGLCLLATAASIHLTPNPSASADLEGSERRIGQWIGLAVVLVLFAIGLSWNLNDFSGRGSLLTWEFSVVEDFADRWKAGDTLLQAFVNRLSWGEGLVSEGESSFLYGTPTYAVLMMVGFHPWTLRLVAVVLSVFGVALAAGLTGRFVNRNWVVVAAVLLATEPHYFFAGHYGTLLSGTFVSIFLAWAGVGMMMRRKKFHEISALIAAVGLYVATLHYAVGRLGVLFILGILGGIAVVALIRRQHGRVSNIFLLFLVLGGLFFWQIKTGHGATFYSTRGEQFLTMVQERIYLEDYLKRPVDPRHVDGATRLEMAWRMIERNASYFSYYLRPSTQTREPGVETVLSDPLRLPLLEASLLPLVVFGFFRCLQSRRWLAFCGLGWLLFFCACILFTTRMDSFRLILCPLPLMMWAVCGVGELQAVWECTSVPRFLRYTLLMLGGLLLFAHGFMRQYSLRPPHSPFTVEMDSVLRQLPPQSLICYEGGASQREWMHLTLLEEARKRRDACPSFLEPGLHQHFLQSEKISSASELRYFLEKTHLPEAILLAPSGTWRVLTEGLRASGYNIQRVELPSDSVTLATRPSNFLLQNVVIPEPPPPLFPVNAPRVSLTTLTPNPVECALNQPSLNADCDGGPISLGRKIYTRGIGVHAWTKMTYTVPTGAIGFESIAGLCDRVRESRTADVEFQLVDDTGKMIYNSGLVTDPDEPIRIAVPLNNVKQLTLIVTQGINGPDDDHADWAEPNFVLSPPR